MKPFLKILPKILGVFVLSIFFGLLASYLSVEVEKNNKSLAAPSEEISQVTYLIIPETSTKLTDLKEPVKPRDPRAISIQKFLRMQKTELAEHSDLIVELSDKYKIDYKLVIAIAGLESGYCNKVSFSNNCWGFGKYSWSSMESALKEYFRLMYVNYFKKGFNTIEKIAPIYNSANTENFLNLYYRHFNLVSGY